MGRPLRANQPGVKQIFGRNKGKGKRLDLNVRNKSGASQQPMFSDDLFQMPPFPNNDKAEFKRRLRGDPPSRENSAFARNLSED